MAGDTKSTGAGSFDGWLLRLDAEGRVLWERTFGGAAWDEFRALAVLPDGGVLVAGIKESTGARDRDNGWLLRLDAEGRILWEGSFGEPDWNALQALAPLPDGSILVAGTTSSGAVNLDAWVLRLNSEGRLE